MATSIESKRRKPPVIQNALPFLRVSRLLADARHFPKLTFLGGDRVHLLQPSTRNCKRPLLFDAGADPLRLDIRLHGEEDGEKGMKLASQAGFPRSSSLH